MPTMTETEVLTGAEAAATMPTFSPRRVLTPERRSQITEAARLVGAAFNGDRRAMLSLQESMTRSDFQNIFGDVLDRELLTQYEQIDPVWPSFARRSTVRDFKAKKYIDLLGGRAELALVPERTEYPARALSDKPYELQVAKYGARLSVTFEMMVNDELDALRDAPQRMAQSARDTEDLTATRLLVEATGPDSDFFSSANGNQLAGNPTLTTDNLSDALTAISTRRDSDGRPIMVRTAILMVPPALEVAANMIINAQEIRITTGSQQITVGNWLRGRVRVLVNPWLPIVDESATADTTWYVLPDPNTPRPAVVLGFLRGYEQPDLRVKNDQGTRVGGGAIRPEDGSFDIDDIQYRVRHILGGTTLEPIATASSTGAGS